MNSHPILFTGDMVRAILDGRKTQTRRIVKNPDWFGCFTGDCPHETQYECDQAIACWVDRECPYGDQLWVKETFRYSISNDCACYDTCKCKSGQPIYRASCGDIKEPGDPPWKPSIFMPREASRITLEIKSVRVERLQDISDEDCLAEGISTSKDKGLSGNGFRNYAVPFEDYSSYAFCEPGNSYRTLWESINGPGSWDKNPWVWVIEFERVKS